MRIRVDDRVGTVSPADTDGRSAHDNVIPPPPRRGRGRVMTVSINTSTDNAACLVAGVRTPFGRYGGALCWWIGTNICGRPLGLSPLATVSSGATVGVPPRVMGIGPSPPHASSRRALATMCIGVGQGISVLLESA